MVYNSLEESLNTKVPVVVVTENPFEFNGSKRTSLMVRKGNGKRVFNVCKYENGKYSCATAMPVMMK